MLAGNGKLHPLGDVYVPKRIKMLLEERKIWDPNRGRDPPFFRTFAVMSMIGFSVNLLTLFALVLAIAPSQAQQTTSLPDTSNTINVAAEGLSCVSLAS